MTHTINVEGQDFRLTTEHAASSYGQPVLVGADGVALGTDDTCRLLIEGGSDEAVKALAKAGYEFDDAR